jgi:DeoR/GlpR family transcriptional regulator of sugar metabolism
MSYNERKEQILSLLERKNSIEVATLTKLLYSSEATVRRDLARLEAEGLIIRTHGRAVSVNLFADKCTSFDDREAAFSLAKRKISEAAVKELVKEGFVVILDASSTVLGSVAYLKEINNLIVVTSGINTLIELTKTNLRFYSTGGRAINASSSFVGQTAIDTLKTFNADICFVSCHGLSEDGFVTDTSERENDLRKVMLSRSKRRVLLIDESKIGVNCWHNLCHISEFDDVFCNVELPDAIAASIKNFHHVKIK